MLTQSLRGDFPGLWVHSEGTSKPECRPLESSALAGTQMTKYCEDVKVSQRLGIALLTCDPSRKKWNPVMGSMQEDARPGALWVYDYRAQAADAEPALVKIDGLPEPEQFHPLGVAIWEETTNRARVFAVNLRKAETLIEVIELHRLQEEQGWTARHVRSIKHPLATHTANSIAPLSKDSFVVTNTHTVSQQKPKHTGKTLHGLYGERVARFLGPLLMNERLVPWIRMLDDFLRFGFITHVDFDESGSYQEGVRAHVIARNLGFPNGIAITHGTTHLVAASSVHSALYFWPIQRWRDDDTPDWSAKDVLGRREQILTPFISDNIDIIPRVKGVAVHRDDPLSGESVILAGHPAVPDFLQAAHEDVPAPSWVVEIWYSGKAPSDADYPVDPAPLPYTERVDHPPPGWSMRTLMQSNGYGESGKNVTASASTAAAWDKRDGRFFVAGIYSDAPIECRGLYA